MTVSLASISARRVALLVAAGFCVASLLSACGAAPPPVEAPPPAATVEEPPPVDQTPTLDIFSDPPVDVKVDGKPAGTTPITAFKVTAGKHDVTFMDPVTGNRTMPVSVEPGETRTVKSDRIPSAILSAPTAPTEPAKPANKKK
jgi:hypothetical protein